MYKTVRRIGVRQPLTISSYPHPLAQALVEPLSDINSIHPYYIWNGEGQAINTPAGYEGYLDECLAAPGAAAKRSSPRRRSGAPWMTRSELKSCATRSAS